MAARTRLARFAGLGGVVYVVLAIIAVAISSGQPSGKASPAEVIAWYSDSGHRDRQNIAWILIMLGLFGMIWFLASLRASIASLDDTGILTQLVLIGGIIYVSLTSVAISLNSAVLTMSDDTYKHAVYPGLIHAANDAFWVINAAGFIGVATMIIASAVAALRATVVRPWIGWLGVVVGVISIAGIVGIPQLIAGVWLIVVSIALFLPGRGRTAEAETTAVE